jgi:hypothetical protein
MVLGVPDTANAIERLLCAVYSVTRNFNSLIRLFISPRCRVMQFQRLSTILIARPVLAVTSNQHGINGDL